MLSQRVGEASASVKKIEKTVELRKLFDQMFQYRSKNRPQIEQENVKSDKPSTPKDQTIGFLFRMCLIIRR